MELKLPTIRAADQAPLAEQLKEDLRQGRIQPERLVDLIVSQQQQLQSARERIEELEKKRGNGQTTKVDEPFSMRAEEKRQEARGKKKRKEKRKGRRGRLKNADKIAKAERTEAIYPKGVDKDRCKLSHVRLVWRLKDGRAMLTAYEIYRGPKKQYGQI